MLHNIIVFFKLHVSRSKANTANKQFLSQDIWILYSITGFRISSVISFVPYLKFSSNYVFEAGTLDWDVLRITQMWLLWIYNQTLLSVTDLGKIVLCFRLWTSSSNCFFTKWLKFSLRHSILHVSGCFIKSRYSWIYVFRYICSRHFLKHSFASGM